MSFVGTEDPDTLTPNDVARWCVELSFVVRANPNDPFVWLSDTLTLYRKIEAITKLAAMQQRDAAKQTPGV